MPVLDPAEYVPEHIFHIDLAAIKWKATGGYGRDADSRACLSAIVQIAGADHFLEAIEVTELDGLQVGADGVDAEFAELDAFAGGGDGPFETVAIEGREYVISMSPFRK